MSHSFVSKITIHFSKDYIGHCSSGTKNWYFSSNLNSHFSGPQTGIDQNRIFVGINRKLNENISIEGGYQLQHLHKKGSLPDGLNHFILVNLNVNLPQIVK